MEDRRATVPAVQNMVGVSGHLSAWNTRHGSSTVRETGAATQEKVACPIFCPPHHTETATASNPPAYCQTPSPGE
jgi:hypothetical protein